MHANILECNIIPLEFRIQIHIRVRICSTHCVNNTVIFALVCNIFSIVVSKFLCNITIYKESKKYYNELQFADNAIFVDLIPNFQKFADNAWDLMGSSIMVQNLFCLNSISFFKLFPVLYFL